MTLLNRTVGAAALATLLAACSPTDSTTTSAGAMAEPAAAEISAKAGNENFGVSYMTGYQIGQNLKGAGLDVDVDVLGQAISDAMAGKESILTDEQQQAAVEAQRAARQVAIERQRQERAVAGEANQTAGKAFLAANGEKEGVTTTDSGLQYEVITMGEGPKPTPEDVVRVHYAGTLIDDTPFDSSYQRGKPAEFPLGGVIKGWTEGLQLMPVGSKFKFVIPSELAYGAQERPGSPIKANSTLVFEVELLAIVGDEKPAKDAAEDS